METKFNHSIKVPNQYKKAAKVLKNSLEKGASVKEQIFSEKHAVNEIWLLQDFTICLLFWILFFIQFLLKFVFLYRKQIGFTH